MRAVNTSARKALFAGLGIAATLALAACGDNTTLNYAAQPTGPVGEPEYRPQPPEAQFSVAFVPGSPQLAPGETERLRARIRGLGIAPGDDIVVTYGLSGSAELDRTRVSTVRGAVGPTAGRLRVFAAQEVGTDLMVNSAVVRVQRYGRLTVVCPGTALNTWELDYNAQMPPGLGCNNAVNRATHASVPRDLLEPRRLRGSEGVTGAAAIKRHQDDEVKFIPLDSNM